MTPVAVSPSSSPASYPNEDDSLFFASSSSEEESGSFRLETFDDEEDLLSDDDDDQSSLVSSSSGSSSSLGLSSLMSSSSSSSSSKEETPPPPPQQEHHDDGPRDMVVVIPKQEEITDDDRSQLASNNNIATKCDAAFDDNNNHEGDEQQPRVVSAEPVSNNNVATKSDVAFDNGVDHQGDEQPRVVESAASNNVATTSDAASNKQSDEKRPRLAEAATNNNNIVAPKSDAAASDNNNNVDLDEQPRVAATNNDNVVTKNDEASNATKSIIITWRMVDNKQEFLLQDGETKQWRSRDSIPEKILQEYQEECKKLLLQEEDCKNTIDSSSSTTSSDIDDELVIMEELLNQQDEEDDEEEEKTKEKEDNDDIDNNLELMEGSSNKQDDEEKEGKQQHKYDEKQNDEKEDNKQHEDESEDDGSLYIIEEFLDSRKTANGTMEYLIRWKGYSPEYDTWEPESSMNEQAVKELHEIMRAKKTAQKEEEKEREERRKQEHERKREREERRKKKKEREAREQQEQSRKKKRRDEKRKREREELRERDRGEKSGGKREREREETRKRERQEKHKRDRDEMRERERHEKRERERQEKRERERQEKRERGRDGKRKTDQNGKREKDRKEERERDRQEKRERQRDETRKKNARFKDDDERYKEGGERRKKTAKQVHKKKEKTRKDDNEQEKKPKRQHDDADNRKRNAASADAKHHKAKKHKTGTTMLANRAGRSTMCRYDGVPGLATAYPQDVPVDDIPPLTFGGIVMDTIHAKPPEKKGRRHMTFSCHLFGNRLHDITRDSITPAAIKNSKEDIAPKYRTLAGRKYELMAVKLDTEKSFIGCSTKHLYQHYICISGKDEDSGQEIPPIDLSEELLKLADFSTLTTRKVKVRLELLLSSARSGKSSNKAMIYDMTADDFEEIDEVAHEGCGFIPRSYLERFFGPKRNVGKQEIFALQVRIFAPRLGIFKGMLCEKPGIKKIQLPSSMKKVEASTKKEGPMGRSRDWACLLVCRQGLHNGRKTSLVGAIVQNKELWEKFEEKRLCEMMQHVIIGAGVSESALRQYVGRSRRAGGSGLRHACVVGLADPTGQIPPGHIFVTGIRDASPEHFKEQDLFVSRYPCTEVCDAHMLPLVTRKPAHMSEEEWEWLQGLPFGGIIFGNPQEGRHPLPTMIAAGDLDGDLYFICWDTLIISQTKNYLMKKVHYPLKNKFRPEEKKKKLMSSPHWFEEGQKMMMDVVGMADINRLISTLYCQWNKRAREEGRTIRDEDVAAFGRAYKTALDIEKHGGKVQLPLHLWESTPKSLHIFLRS